MGPGEWIYMNAKYMTRLILHLKFDLLMNKSKLSTSFCVKRMKSFPDRNQFLSKHKCGQLQISVF